MNNVDDVLIISREDYTKMIIENRAGLLNPKKIDSIDHWVNFSLLPQEEEAIRTIAVYSELTGRALLCYSYICSYSILREEFIQELIFITSPFFSLDYYTRRYIRLVCSIVCKPINDRKTYLEILAEDESLHPYFREIAKNLSSKKNGIIILDKIDWYGILFYQNDISEDFVLAFRNDIDTRFLATYFNIKYTSNTRGNGGNAPIRKELEKLAEELENEGY